MLVWVDPETVILPGGEAHIHSVEPRMNWVSTFQVSRFTFQERDLLFEPGRSKIPLIL